MLTLPMTINIVTLNGKKRIICSSGVQLIILKKMLCFSLVPALMFFAVFTAVLIFTAASYSALSNNMHFESLEGKVSTMTS